MSTRQTRGFWPMRDLPAVFWLLAAVVVAFAHPLVPAPRWLLIHLILLGAATHSILVWSRYFTDALLHTAPDPGDRARQNRRLALLNAGVLIVVAGVLSAHWSITTAGAVCVIVAVGWHGIGLATALRTTLAARFAGSVRYYVAAAALLPVGAAMGAVLARVQGEPWHERLLVAHASVNLLGWIGLTAAGTLVTLWPTMLRTRIAPQAERAAARALPVLLIGITLAVAAPLVDVRPVGALGYAAYLVGLGMLAPPFVAALRAKPPTGFSTFSVLSALAWLAGCLVCLVGAVATADSWDQVDARFGWFTPFLAAGFGAQLLLGAMSYLVPVALGGGPRPVRTATIALDRAGLLRVVVTNGALLVCILPVPAAVRVVASSLVLVSLGSFLPLLVLAIRASTAVRKGAEAPPVPVVDLVRLRRQAALGVVVVLLAALGGVAVDRVGLASLRADPVSAGVAATGHTTTVRIEARDMRFHPSSISVPAGDRLVVELSNTDAEDVHDLVLDDGTDSRRLSPGESARLEVGIVGRDVAGWCSVIGHRQMGMALTITATGSPRATARTTTDPPASAGAGFRAHDARLPALEQGRVHRVTFHVRDEVIEVAPGRTQALWTYNGSAPGPILHGRVGDRFVVRLVNDASMSHSIDFHAGERAPDRVMRSIPPGEQLVYRFTATRAGIWMYHCSSMPMSAHIANGLFGAVIIDPPDLPAVDRSYVLLQSELYLGPQAGEVDVDKLLAERPDLVTFNGYANQYDHRPLRARVGERVRVWVLDAGPNRATSFHVVGAQFDTTYAEGAWLLGGPGAAPSDGGSQSLALQPGQGGFVELGFTEPGHYPFVSHLMVDAERGAHGVFRVTP